VQRHQIVATIPLTPGIGQNPVAIAADPTSPLTYVANQDSTDLTVISGTEILGMIAGFNSVGYYAVQIGVHPSTGLLYTIEERQSPTAPVVRDTIMQEITGTQVITTVRLYGCSTDRGACAVTGMTFQPATGYTYLLRWAQAHYLLPLYGSIAVLEGSKVLTTTTFEDVLPRFIAADPQRGWVYVTSELTTSVFVLSGTTVVGTVPVTDAGQVQVLPVTGRAYVQQGERHLALLSGTTGLGAFRVGVIEAIAADPTGRYLYVTHPATPTVTVVSGTAVLTEIDVISPGGRLEIDGASGLTYLRHPDAPYITILSGTTVMTQVEVTGGDAAIAANPTTGLVYAVSGDRSVTVLEGTQPLLNLPPASPQPRVMALHPLSDQLVLLSDPPALSLIKNQAIIATTPLTAAPGEMLVHPQSGLIYLTLPEDDAVLVMSRTTVLATVAIESLPTDIAVQPATGFVYVPGYDGTLAILDGTTKIASVNVGDQGFARVAANAASGLVYVTDPYGHEIHVLTGTKVLTDISAYGPGEVAVEPHSGLVYVETAYDGLWVISHTTMLTSVALDFRDVVDMQPAGSSGYLYLQLCFCSVYNHWEHIGIVYGTQQVAEWVYPYPDHVTRFSGLRPHPSLSYLYAGHALYGSQLTVGAGTTLVEAITAGDGSWVRDIAVAASGMHVYVATDHAITILESELPHQFFLPLLSVKQGGGAH
jgi:DNA-binding beta-propeller fold protein YncE